MSQSFALDEIRRLIDAFSSPMLASRYGRVAAVNAAWEQLSGYSRAEAEGQEFIVFLPPEERRRMQARAAQRAAGVALPGGPTTTQLLARDGRLIELLVDVTVMSAAEGEPYVVTTLLRQRERQPELDFALLLVETSAALVSVHATAELHQALLERFERGGLWAGLYRLEADSLVEQRALAGRPVELNVVHAEEALREGRPVFAGVELAPTHVYLPLRAQPTNEVLVLHGGPLGSALGVLSLFSKLVGSALQTVDDRGRVSQKLSDTGLMLDLARITSATLDIDIILDAACDAMVRLLEVSNCHILPYDPQSRVLQHIASSNRRRGELSWVKTSLDDPDSLTALAARTRAPVVVEDIRNTALPYNRKIVTELGETALLALPLICRDDLLGVAMLADTGGPRVFPPEAIERAEAALGQVALSLANARLYASLKQSYAELAETKAQMLERERLAGLGELAAIVAHEVRNPLGAIFNAVSCLAPFVPKGEDPQQLLEILRQESERLDTLVTDLLHYARPRAVDLQHEDVGAVIQESLALARLPRMPRPLAVSCELAPELPRVPMDRRMMCQALVNVIHNAVQAMPQGGTLRIVAEHDPRESGDGVRIEVRDQGGGIAPEIAARMFEPFFTTKAQGTGLGLALVKRIVADHCGEVHVESAPGQGTAVVFRLPVGRREAPAA